MNRTTNERFSRRKQVTRKPSTVSDRSSIASRTDSTVSSLMSAHTAILAEDIIKDMGAAEDYSDRVIPCCANSFAMCCHRTPVNQQEIFDALI